jgi:hypothetical protein
MRGRRPAARGVCVACSAPVKVTDCSAIVVQRFVDWAHGGGAMLARAGHGQSCCGCEAGSLAHTLLVSPSRRHSSCGNPAHSHERYERLGHIQSLYMLGAAQKSAWVGCNCLCLTKCERKRWCVVYLSLTAAKMGVIDGFCRRRDGDVVTPYTKFVYPRPRQPPPWLMSCVV